MISIVAGLLLAIVSFLFVTSNAKKKLSANDTVRLGIGAFPDAMPILVGIGRDFFPNMRISIRLLNWAKADDAILEGHCDAIFGPKHFMKVGTDGPVGGAIIVGNSLAFYMGFGLLISRGAKVKAYQEFRREGRSRVEAKQLALAQLPSSRIICMSSDAAAAVHRIAHGQGMQLNPSNIGLAEEPNAAFKKFLNIDSGEPTFFVGGVTQRLIADREKISCLISEQDEDLATTEHVAFMTRNLPLTRCAELEEGWYRCVSAMHKDRSFRIDMLKLMNELIAPLYENFRFTENDLLDVMYRYEYFPSTPEEAEVVTNKDMNAAALRKEILSEQNTQRESLSIVTGEERDLRAAVGT